MRTDEQMEKYTNDPRSWFTKEEPNPPKMAATAYSQFHIEGCARQVDELVRQVSDHVAGLDTELANLKEIIDEHLWIPKGFSETALASLRETRARTEAYKTRLEAVRDGFRALPREGSHG